MSNRKKFRLLTLRNLLLFGIVMVIPIAILSIHIQTVSAETITEEGNVCVIAYLNDNPAVVTYYGACILKPDPTDSATPEPSPEATPEITTSPEVSPSPEPSPEPEVTHTHESPEPTSAPEPEPTQTPSPSATATPQATQTTTPTPAPTQTIQPTPSPSPTTKPTYDIPPENKDPKTTEFRFCHHGEMHSNSYTGMLNGHHDKHPEDIIPPIPFKGYPGWNWNETNAQTFYNNCDPVT